MGEKQFSLGTRRGLEGRGASWQKTGMGGIQLGDHGRGSYSVQV